MTDPLPSDFFRRIDDSEDEQFYSYPRLVVHIDDGAIAKVSALYARLLPQGGAILDLMSSWRSHLPEHLRSARVIGVGLNEVEMKENPALTQAVVHNLNREPNMPLDPEQFDGAVVTVSVQYMTRPVEIFRDVGRVLKPGAPFIVTYSNRMFPTKAVAIWQSLDDYDRGRLVWRYFRDSGAFENIEAIDLSAPTEPPSDPIWAVVGYRKREDSQS